jgi:AmmeMemoRadiSam system protein A
MLRGKKISEETKKMKLHELLKKQEKEKLLHIARQSIACCFEADGFLSERIAFCKKEMFERYKDSAVSAFALPLACFVTLTRKEDGELRGCIGNLEAGEGETLLGNVIRNSMSAAFYDSRFEPLEPDELPEVKIEISVLSKPEIIDFEDKEGLFTKIAGKGVVLQRGFYWATFLPQVWEKLPQPELFLRHLAAKAGLPASAWTEASYAVYEVESFEEN